MSTINLTAALNFDDSQFKSGIKSVEQSLKKFSTAKNFVKLKLDDKDFRKQFQPLVNNLQKQLEKLGALNYKTKGGKAKVADSIGTMKSAYSYFLDQSTNEKLSTREQNAYKKKEEAMRQYLNLLKLIGDATKRNSQLEREQANMALRMAKAQMTGQVQAARQKAARTASAEDRALAAMPNIAKNIGKHNKDYLASKQIADPNKRMAAELAALKKLIGAWEAYGQKALAAGNSKKAALATSVTSKLKQEQKQLENNKLATVNQAYANKQLSGEYKTQMGMLGNLKNLLTRYLSIYSVINFFKQLVNVTKEFDRQKVALEALTGSAVEANKAIRELQQMALKSPFQFNQLVDYTKKLAAYSIDNDALLSTTHKLAEISAGIGVDMDRLIIAYGQVKSAAVLRGQELRQFTEAGIPLVQKLADKFTALNGELVTTGEIFEKISNREVSFEMVDSVLTDMTSEGGKFYNMQETLTGTLYGQIAKLKDVWNLTLLKVGRDTNGVINKIVKALTSLVRNIRSIAKGAYVFGILWTVRKAFETIIAIKIGITKIIAATNAATAAARGWGATVAAVRTILSTGIMFVISAIVAAFSSANEEAEEWADNLADIETSHRRETQKMIDGLDSLINKLASATEGSKKYSDALETLKSNYGDYVNDSIVNALIEEQRQLSRTADGWNSVAEQIKSAIKMKDEYNKKVELKETSYSGLMNKFSGDYLSKFELDAEDYLEIFTNDNRVAYSRMFAMLEGGLNLRSKWDLDSAIEDYGEHLSVLIQLTVSKFLEEVENTKMVDGDVFKKIYTEQLEKLGGSEFLKTQAYKLLPKVFNDLVNSAYFATYKDSIKQLNNDVYNAIEMVFNETMGVVLGLETPDKFVNEDIRNMSLIHQLALTAKELVSKKEGVTYKDENAKKEIEDFFELVTSGTSLVRSLKYELGMFSTSEAVHYVTLLKNIVEDSDLSSQLAHALDIFTENVTLRTGRAKFVAEAIEKYAEGKTQYERTELYRYMPEDYNFDEVRNRIKEEHDEIQSKIKSYGDTAKGENLIYVELLKKKAKKLEILAGEDFFDIDLTQDSSSAQQLSNELSEFFEEIKNAYTRYKEATEKFGNVAGVQYAKLDEKFNEMFGEFFQGNNSEAFKELANLKIGDKSIFSILEDNFISGGLEDGIISFEDAIKDLIVELNAYGNADKKNRKAYLNAAKQLDQWLTSTISKDSLSTAYKQLEQEIKTLTRSFEDSSRAVDTYREMQKKGTKDLGKKVLGVSDEDAYKPESVARREYVNKLISAFSNTGGAYLKELKDERQRIYDELKIYNLSEDKEKELTEEKEAINSKLIIAKELSNFNGINIDTSSIQGINNAIEQLDDIKKMNNDAWSTTIYGKSGDELRKALVELRDVIHKELKDISGESYTGNTLEDTITNSFIKLDGILDEQAKSYNTAGLYDEIDMSAIKEVSKVTQEEAKKIFDAFTSSINLDVLGRANNFYINKNIVEDLEESLGNIADKLPDALRDELNGKFQNLIDSIDDYNSKTGSAKAYFDAIRDYRGADEYAREKWEKESKINASIADQLSTPELRAMLTDKEIIDLEAQLARSNERLEEMGGSAEAFAEKLKSASLERLQRSVNEFQNKFNSIKSSVDEVISTFKTLFESVRKVYDMLNKGEEPEWMKEMDSFLGDFGEAFEALVAPMMSIISLVSTLTIAFVTCEAAMTPLLIAMTAILAVSAVVAGVIAAVNAKDNRLQRTIEELEKQINDTQNAISNLNSEMGRMVGYEKLEASLKSLSLTYDNFRNAQAQAKAELAKPHKFDEEKYKEFLQNAKGYLNDFYDGIKEFTEGLTFSIEDIAGRISDAMRSAFQNGTNAARDMAVDVKESIGDIVENMMRVTFLEPMIKSAFETFIGGSKNELMDKFTYTENGEEKWDSDKALEYLMDRLSDPELLSNLERDFNAASEGYLEFFNSLDKTLQDYFSYNADSSSSLYGGISGITEDTARTLEGLANSMLMQQIVSNDHLASINAHLIATIQTSWFNDMLQQAKATRQASENINKAIEEMRNGHRPMSVTVL